MEPIADLKIEPNEVTLLSFDSSNRQYFGATVIYGNLRQAASLHSVA
jgi:hypothetical protein